MLLLIVGLIHLAQGIACGVHDAYHAHAEPGLAQILLLETPSPPDGAADVDNGCMHSLGAHVPAIAPGAAASHALGASGSRVPTGTDQTLPAPPLSSHFRPPIFS